MTKPMLLTTVAAGGDNLIHNLFMVLIYGLCAAIVWALGRQGIKVFALAPVALQIWNGLFLLVGAVILINFLLSLVGHAFMPY